MIPKPAGKPQSLRTISRSAVTRWIPSLQDVRDFSELNFTGHASALGNALHTATEQWRGQPVAGVLLFTDGNSTDVLPDGASLDGCPPVYPVIIGNESGLQDISLNKVAVSQTAFEDAPVTVQAEVSARGFAGSESFGRHAVDEKWRRAPRRGFTAVDDELAVNRLKPGTPNFAVAMAPRTSWRSRSNSTAALMAI